MSNAPTETSPTLTQWAFTSPFEGVVQHLYLDSRGYVTCGVGFLVASKAALDQYPWHPSVEMARLDYDALSRLPAGGNYAARYYAQLTSARLRRADMLRLFEEKVAGFRMQIAKLWKLDTLPLEAQIVLVDMAYNMGARRLSKFVNLRAAIERRDWATAAKECSRRGVPVKRNGASAALLAQLARR